MPAPLNVAFHNHYNDVYENKAVNVPTYSNKLKIVDSINKIWLI